MTEPRQNSLVKFVLPSPEYELYFKPLMDERYLVYLGEIPQMRGHCVVAGHSGRVYSCYHTSDFIELTEDEV